MAPVDHALAHTAAMVRMHRSVGSAARRRAVPRSRPPLLVESDYAGRIATIVDRLRARCQPAIAILRDDLTSARAARHDARLAYDAVTGPGRVRTMLDHVRSQMIDMLRPNALDILARQFADRTSSYNREQLGRQVKAALGIDLVALDTKLPVLIDHFAAENVSLIESLGNATLDSVSKIAMRAYTSGQTTDSVVDEMQARFGIGERHARLIARDQIGKLNSAVAASRHQDIGIKSFDWQTMGDERVREEHQALDGRVFTYASGGDPEEGLPGEAICCRCQQGPNFDDILDAADDD